VVEVCILFPFLFLFLAEEVVKLLVAEPNAGANDYIELANQDIHL
jgi:hypothetical protein